MENNWQFKNKMLNQYKIVVISLIQILRYFVFQNYTAIVDVSNKRCYITPLDRSLVVPPQSLYDLFMKMRDG